MRFGQIPIEHPFLLAPMEEHTSFPLRRLMRKRGASYVCTERMNAREVARNDRRAVRLLHTQPNEQPCAAQISGSQPEDLANAARNIEEQGFAVVDLNFECPVRRLCPRGEGGFLLDNPLAIERLVAEVVRAVPLPVTVHIRSGRSPDRFSAVEVAQRAAAAGAVAVHVHARFTVQAYQGDADWSVIERVKQAVSIPVIGSGGVREAADAVRLLRTTGADGVEIGRGCLGNPWIFRDSLLLWKGRTPPSPPTPLERGDFLMELAEDEFVFFGHEAAIRRLPRISHWFALSLPEPDLFREAVVKVKRLEEFRRLVHEHFRRKAVNVAHASDAKPTELEDA